jgi:hypothetical protein
VTDITLKDVLPLTADLTTAELAEALGALRFHGKSCSLVSLERARLPSARHQGAMTPAASRRHGLEDQSPPGIRHHSG